MDISFDTITLKCESETKNFEKITKRSVNFGYHKIKIKIRFCHNVIMESIIQQLLIQVLSSNTKPSISIQDLKYIVQIAIFWIKSI